MMVGNLHDCHFGILVGQDLQLVIVGYPGRISEWIGATATFFRAKGQIPLTVALPAFFCSHPPSPHLATRLAAKSLRLGVGTKRPKSSCFVNQLTRELSYTLIHHLVPIFSLSLSLPLPVKSYRPLGEDQGATKVIWSLRKIIAGRQRPAGRGASYLLPYHLPSSQPSRAASPVVLVTSQEPGHGTSKQHNSSVELTYGIPTHLPRTER